MKKITGSLPFRLLLGVILGIIVGQICGDGLMHVIVTIKYILNQVIVFCVPLIIIGFIAPSITRLGNNACICFVNRCCAVCHDGRLFPDSPSVHYF